MERRPKLSSTCWVRLKTPRDRFFHARRFLMWDTWTRSESRRRRRYINTHMMRMMWYEWEETGNARLIAAHYYIIIIF